MENNIIILPPGILDAETKVKAEEKGYIVIETNEPEKVKVITPASLTSPDDILLSALYALSEGINSSDKFIRELNRRLKLKEVTNGK